MLHSKIQVGYYDNYAFWLAQISNIRKLLSVGNPRWPPPHDKVWTYRKNIFFLIFCETTEPFECRLGWNVPWMVWYKNPRVSSSQNIVLTYKFSNKTRSVIESKLYMKNHWMVPNKKFNFYGNWKSIVTANTRQYLT